VLSYWQFELYLNDFFSLLELSAVACVAVEDSRRSCKLRCSSGDRCGRLVPLWKLWSGIREFPAIMWKLIRP
jgi:hypothetical protein